MPTSAHRSERCSPRSSRRVPGCADGVALCAPSDNPGAADDAVRADSRRLRHQACCALRLHLSHPDPRCGAQEGEPVGGGTAGQGPDEGARVRDHSSIAYALGVLISLAGTRNLMPEARPGAGNTRGLTEGETQALLEKAYYTLRQEPRTSTLRSASRPPGSTNFHSKQDRTDGRRQAGGSNHVHGIARRVKCCGRDVCTYVVRACSGPATWESTCECFWGEPRTFSRGRMLGGSGCDRVWAGAVSPGRRRQARPPIPRGPGLSLSCFRALFPFRFAFCIHLLYIELALFSSLLSALASASTCPLPCAAL